jgi:hypothetical protein
MSWDFTPLIGCMTPIDTRTPRHDDDFIEFTVSAPTNENALGDHHMNLGDGCFRALPVFLRD